MKDHAKDSDDHTAVESSIDELQTASGNFQSHALIIPLDAPLPNELQSVDITSGNLYERMAPLSCEKLDTLVLVPISPNELLALSRSWAWLVNNKKIAVLTDLPGVTYDIFFDQAKRAAGLASVEWPSIEQATAERLVTKQRTSDTQPWVDPITLDDSEDKSSNDKVDKRKPTMSGLSESSSVIAEPQESAFPDTDTYD